MRRQINLSNSFLPKKYIINLSGNKCTLLILGKKLPPPAKRLALDAKKFKIIKVQITAFTKKSSDIKIVKRLNYLSKLEQLRIHTDAMLYPGPYQISLELELSSKQAEQIILLAKTNDWSKSSLSSLFPCIDEPESRGSASFELNYIDG